MTGSTSVHSGNEGQRLRDAALSGIPAADSDSDWRDHSSVKLPLVAVRREGH